MAYMCDSCGKTTVYGRQSTHHRGVAGKRWKKRAQKTLRTFRPNLQKATILVSGKPVQMKLCTDCIKKFKNLGMVPSRAKSSKAVLTV